MRLLVSALAAAFCITLAAVTVEASQPRVFHGARAGSLETSRQRLAAGDRGLRTAVDRLVAEADVLLHVSPPSVTHKTRVAPSGDSHDYASLAPYYWPDPQSADGLPYVRRDGRRNPEWSDLSLSDGTRVALLGRGIETLGLAWYFTHDAVYARQAAAFARCWFVADNTRMNPNLRFAQAVRGVNDGRPAGILEGRHLARAIDALALLGDADVLTPAEQRRIDDWGRAYLEWLLESDPGRDERDAPNNHGTFYDLQVATFALAVGRVDLARGVLERVGPRRIAIQIEPDGSQTHELDRTRSFSYSLFNLDGLVRLATLGDYLGLDIWSCQEADGRSIRRAIDFLVPYLDDGTRRWPHEQISEVSAEDSSSILWCAAVAYDDPRLTALADRSVAKNDRVRLLFTADAVVQPSTTSE